MNSKKRNAPIIPVLFCCLFFLLLLAGPVLAQAVDYRINLRRDFGYGNGADIRGNFSMTVHGPQKTIRSVTYLLDNQEIGQVNESPFRVRFVTGDFPDGWHDLTAVIETLDGRQVTTPPVRVNFISATQQSRDFTRILGTLFGAILIITAVGIGIQSFLMRSNKQIAPGTPRNYGVLGGTICPRCNRPYPLHIWGVNLIGGKLDRCDYCGKWALVRRATPDKLAAAEQAELEAARGSETSLPGAGEESNEEQLRRQLDESRYSKL